MKRSLRRHHKERMTKKAKQIYPDVKCHRKYADNIKCCSCWGCKRGKSVKLEQEYNIIESALRQAFFEDDDF